MVVLVVTGVDNLIDGAVVAVVVVELIEGMLGLVVEGIENFVADVEVVEGVVRGFVVAENEGNNEVGVVDAVLDVSVVSFEIFKVLGADVDDDNDDDNEIKFVLLVVDVDVLSPVVAVEEEVEVGVLVVPGSLKLDMLKVDG